MNRIISITGALVSGVLLMLSVAALAHFLPVNASPATRLYGFSVFLFLPVQLGGVSAWLHGRGRPRTLRERLGVAALTITAALLLALLLAFEGAICLLMVSPLAFGGGLLGAWAVHALTKQQANPTVVGMCLVTLAPGAMLMESLHPPRAPVHSVTTRVHVAAPPEEVWKHVVAVSALPAPSEWLFRAGISYPVESTLSGTGVGARRACRFNTGTLTEPITAWREPELLAFDVTGSIAPMTELSFYDHVNAPHVEGFFRSVRGEFRLHREADGTTMVEGTSWYTHDIWPQWYWQPLSDAIIGRIHLRVLQHVREEVENAQPPLPM